jgi:6-pyruvoyltetrahydropterin/6-carboxytetrahydropterin synthase
MLVRDQAQPVGAPDVHPGLRPTERRSIANPAWKGSYHMRVRLSKTFRFEAAHDLPTFPPGHKCRRLHGHSFVFDVIVEGVVDESLGYLIDYADIKAAVAPLVDQLDHHYLNEIDGLAIPTSEVLSRWIYQQVKPKLPLLAAVIVHETCTSTCEYRGDGDPRS